MSSFPAVGEKFSQLDFVDKNVDDIVPQKPPPLESTPFKLVEEVKDLKALAAKLRNVDEFAVDLEHNQYRSFQGLTCLMQISTRSEDFVVDTLKLRIHIGPHLRELFKDPTKKKVMHGSERDIMRLQQDFGIYICNLFDTEQASRVLKLERNSLEYLLLHFCGVTANKEYQNAEWRLRPLPTELLRYAREDAHYLLYIYDILRILLLSSNPELEQSDPPLVEDQIQLQQHQVQTHQVREVHVNQVRQVHDSRQSPSSEARLKKFLQRCWKISSIFLQSRDVKLKIYRAPLRSRSLGTRPIPSHHYFVMRG